MFGVMQQTPNQLWHQIPGRSGPGQSGNPAGRPSRAKRQACIDARARELATEFGGWDKLSTVDRVYVEQAAALLLRKPHSAEDAVRWRLLAAVERRKGPGKQSSELEQLWRSGRP